MLVLLYFLNNRKTWWSGLILENIAKCQLDSTIKLDDIECNLKHDCATKRVQQVPDFTYHSLVFKITKSSPIYRKPEHVLRTVAHQGDTRRGSSARKYVAPPPPRSSPNTLRATQSLPW